MILSDKTIKTILRSLVDLGSSENVSIEDLQKQINPNSIDLTIGSTYKRPVKSAQQWVYGFRHQKEADKYAADCWKKSEAKSGYILLEPGAVILACTREFITMPENICGQIYTKSTLGRMFINHMMAGVVDAGFSGRLTLELKNEGPHIVRIPVGARVVQMVLEKLDKAAAEPYGKRPSRYDEAFTAECAKMEQKA